MFLNQLTQREKEAFLELAHIISKSNGFVDEKEKQLIRQFEQEMGLEGYQIKGMSFEEIISTIQNDYSKKIFFIESLATAYADGEYQKEQEDIIIRLKEEFGYSDQLYRRFKEWMEKLTRLYSEINELMTAE